MNCEAFQARLISGEKPNEDAALSAHVGSCLRCFRTASDMRDVPRLAALLREGPGSPGAIEGEGAYDPGSRFWETFPPQVAAAWLRSRPARGGGWWERVSLWLRRPVPAALTGAVCAVGLALLVMRPSAGPPSGTPVLSGEVGLAAEVGAPIGSQIGAEIGEGAGETGDEAIRELDFEALVSLRDQLDRALGPSDGVLPAVETGDEGASASDPANLAEDLEMLDETGLLALSQKLGPRI